MRIFLPLLAALAVAAQPVRAQTPSTPAAVLDTLRQLDIRVATIGHRLAVGSRDLCSTPVWLSGIVMHDIGQYAPALRGLAAQDFGLGQGPAVLALAAGAPAERAGLRLNDVLLFADSQAVPNPPGNPQNASFAGTETIWTAIETAMADGRSDLVIRRGGETRTIAVTGEQGCPTRFQLMPSDRLNARADGTYVQVTTAIGAFVADDDELAWVLAHEFAHNLLGHRRRLNAAGIQRGLLQQFGRNARLTRNTEMEADRLSIHLVARAGYDPQAALRFWQRFGPRRMAFLQSPTHPRWQDRVRLLQEEIARMAPLRAAGQPLMPAFLAAAGGKADLLSPPS